MTNTRKNINTIAKWAINRYVQTDVIIHDYLTAYENKINAYFSIEEKKHITNEKINQEIKRIFKQFGK